MNVAELLQNGLNLLNWLAVNIPWDAVAASGVLSPLLLAIRKWRVSKNIESLFKKDWFVYLTLLFLSFMTVAIEYILTSAPPSPEMLGIRTAVLAFTTQPIYFFAVKPGLRWFSKQIDAAAELKLAQSATEPSTGVPTGTVTVGSHTYPVPASPQTAKIDDFTH